MLVSCTVTEREKEDYSLLVWLDIYDKLTAGSTSQQEQEEEQEEERKVAFTIPIDATNSQTYSDNN